MKNLIFTLFLFVSTCLFGGKPLQSAVTESHPVLTEQVSYTDETVEGYKYEVVFENGSWWIYEYNEDGEIVNIYPIDE